MKTQATLLCKLSGRAPRTALASVLAPDNIDIPQRLSIKEEVNERSVGFRVSSESPSSAISTVLAFLNDLTLFQEIWLLSLRKDAGTRRTT